MLLRLAYLGVTNPFAMLRLLPISDRDRDAEILALRHQIVVLQRQLGERKPRFEPSDRAFLAALLHRLPMNVLRQVRLLVRPDTVLRWHRDLFAAGTRSPLDPTDQAVHARRGPSGHWCCVWPETIHVGATGVCTANCWSWA